jgi:transcriptional regulator with XRE-family HTH domain
VDIASRLRSLLKSSGLSQAEVARRAGISATRFNNYVSGDRIPDNQMLDRIAAILGTDADQLNGATESLSTVLAGILTTLFRLNGLPPERGALMAEVAVEALRAIRSLPDDGDAELRSRLAAQIAWQQHTGPKPQL